LQTSYKMVWDRGNPLKVVVEGCVPENSFVLRGLETPEERLARKAQEAANTHMENLAQLFRNHFDSRWRASDLYPWMEENAPGYKVGVSNKSGAILVFQEKHHAMMFKLAWS